MLRTSEGTLFGSGGAISATGVETVREREENARKEALIAVARRECIRQSLRAIWVESLCGRMAVVMR